LSNEIIRDIQVLEDISSPSLFHMRLKKQTNKEKQSNVRRAQKR